MRFGMRCNVQRFLGGAIGREGLSQDASNEGLRIAEVGVLPRQACVLLDGEVCVGGKCQSSVFAVAAPVRLSCKMGGLTVLVHVIQVKRSSGAIGHLRRQSKVADGIAKVRSKVVACFYGGYYVTDVYILAVVRQEIVIRKRIYTWPQVSRLFTLVRVMSLKRSKLEAPRLAVLTRTGGAHVLSISQ